MRPRPQSEGLTTDELNSTTHYNGSKLEHIANLQEIHDYIVERHYGPDWPLVKAIAFIIWKRDNP